MNKKLILALGESVLNTAVYCTECYVIGSKMNSIIKDKIDKNNRSSFNVGVSLVGATLVYAASTVVACFINNKIWDTYADKECETDVSEYNNTTIEASEDSTESGISKELLKEFGIEGSPINYYCQ